MNYSGALRTSGRARYRNWRTEPHKRQYDEFYFKALTYRVQTLDALVIRTAIFAERKEWMKKATKNEAIYYLHDPQPVENMLRSQRNLS